MTAPAKAAPQGQEGGRYVAELREIAGMVAQSPDGPLRWKQYRLTAIADYLSALAPAAIASGRGEAE